MPFLNTSNRLPATGLAMMLLLNAPLSIYASEGGYSNYIPGFYGDIALAVEPADGFAIRNDVYFYSAEADKTVRSGAV